jgi:septum site-determining protein MinD
MGGDYQMPTHNCTVYTVAGAKGGVGRTTTSINMGAALAEAGHEVAVLELDLAMANLAEFLDVGTTATLHEVLAGEASVADATYPAADGLSLVPSGTSLEGYARTDLSRLSDVAETVRERYDTVLVDTPAGLSQESIRAMALADEVVLISTPRVSSIRNADGTVPLADYAETAVSGLVLTKSAAGTSAVVDHVASCLDVSVIGRVPADDAVPYAQEHGQPVVEHAPHSAAAVAYRKITRRLTGATTTRDTTLDRVDGTGVDRTPAGDGPVGDQAPTDPEDAGKDPETDETAGPAGELSSRLDRTLRDVFGL